MFRNDGCTIGRSDPLVPSFLERQRGWRERADELPESVKLYLLMTEHLRRTVGYRYYAKAVNQVPRLRAAYDAVLAGFDLLLMPTTPMQAPPLPRPDSPREVVLGAGLGAVANTAPFDLTHHPALSLPCGFHEGLPVGLMLVGRHFAESTLYRAARALERDLEESGAR
jgi:amidase